MQPTMLKVFSIALFSSFLVLASSGGIDEKIPLIGPGHPSLKTTQLKFPRAVYYSRAKAADGSWQTRGLITEQGRERNVDGKILIDRSQVQTFNDGKSFIDHVAAFDKQSLTPHSSKRRSSLPQFPKGFVKTFELTYEHGALTGTQEKEGEGTVPFPKQTMKQAMFEGDVLGVVLAALPLKKGFKARLPVMYSQMGLQYTVVARVVGTRAFRTATGEVAEAWAVETDWHDLASGQVSPGGGSGGTYYVIPDPPTGYPHVPKYMNDTFDTEVLPQMSL